MRLPGAALAGLLMAIALFLIMSQMISDNNDVNRGTDASLNLDFIRLNLEEVENIRRRVPPPPPEQAEALERPPRLAVVSREAELQDIPEIEPSLFSTDTLNFSFGLGQGRYTGTMPLGDFDEDGDLYPLLQVSPIYPASARLKRVYGWVDLEYTVLPDGSVVDVVVVDSEATNQRLTNEMDRASQDTFNEAAVNAISRWKFKPRVVNGQAVPVRVTQRINFDLLNQ